MKKYAVIFDYGGWMYDRVTVYAKRKRAVRWKIRSQYGDVVIKSIEQED